MASRATDRSARLLHLQLAGYHALAAAAADVRRDGATGEGDKREVAAHFIGRQIAGADPKALH